MILALGMQISHGPLSSSFLGLPYRILNINHKKELLRGLMGSQVVERRDKIWFLVAVSRVLGFRVTCSLHCSLGFRIQGPFWGYLLGSLI